MSVLLPNWFVISPNWKLECTTTDNHLTAFQGRNQTCNRSFTLNRFFSIALMLLILLGTLRGGATSISKYVSINEIPPLAYSMWQSLIVALLLVPMGFVRSRQFPPLARHPRYFIFCALVGVAIPNVTFFYVVQTVQAGTMAVLLTLAPIVTYALVLMLGMERISPLRVVGVTLGFGGALMIAVPSVSSDIEINWWIIIGLICPFGYASMSVFISRYPLTGYHLFLLVGGSHLVAFLFLFPITLATDNLVLLWDDPGLVQALIVCHGFIAAIAYSLFFKIVELAGPVFYSFSTYIIAITGILWGWLIFDESHPSHFWLAVASIFVGLAIINYRRALKPAAGKA